MTWIELITSINTTHFTNYQVQRLFPQESSEQINMQLWRWNKQDKLVRLKQGLYVFAGADIEEFTISGLLYQPSYVTAESVLNTAGIIPDIPMSTVAVTPQTTKMYKNYFGRFQYHKIKSELYFGFRVEQDANGQDQYYLGEPEKALLDYLYLRKISELSGTRLDTTHLNKVMLAKFAVYFPDWVQQAAADLVI